MVNLQRCSASEFATFFRGMKLYEKNDFVNLYRNEIMLVEDPDKLRVLCEYGYMMALIPMLGLVSEDEILEWYKKLYPRNKKSHPVIALTLQEETILMQYAGSHLDIAKYLREETDVFFDDSQRPIPYQKILYSTSTNEVCEYFYEYLINRGIAMSYKSGEIFFRRGTKEQIERYAKKIGQFDHTHNTFSVKMAQTLFDRNDLTEEEKYELFWYIIRNFKINRSGFYALKRANFIRK